MKIVRLFLCPDMQKQTANIQSRAGKEDEIYAIYRTGSRAGSKADGLADVSEKLRAL